MTGAAPQLAVVEPGHQHTYQAQQRVNKVAGTDRSARRLAPTDSVADHTSNEPTTVSSSTEASNTVQPGEHGNPPSRRERAGPELPAHQVAEIGHPPLRIGGERAVGASSAAPLVAAVGDHWLRYSPALAAFRRPSVPMGRKCPIRCRPGTPSSRSRSGVVGLTERGEPRPGLFTEDLRGSGLDPTGYSSSGCR
jgi:hypothetical protein